MDVVELAAAARHGCKVCGKSFLCGRSLGGHMRSHISLGDGEAALEVHADDELRRASPNGGRSCNGVVGYGLRENPRKTRRLSDFANDEDDGGHGVGDGDGDGDGEQHRACRECGKLFSSWRSLFGHMRRSHASGGRYRDDEDDVDVEDEELVPVPEEAEAEMVTPTEAPVEAAPAAALAVLSAPPRRRRRTMRVAAPAPAPPPPPVLSGFEKEPEDVALCLLMLSRDTGMRSTPAKVEPLESAEKQAGLPRSGYNSNDDSALLQYGGAKISKSRKRGSPKPRRDPEAPKRTRYECPGCGKVFSSYQALGGHRASHKRINARCSSPKATPAASPAPEPSTETYASFNTLSPSASPDSVAVGFGKPPKDDEAVADAKFECAVCFRVFASGQALGWHKRSHLMPSESDDVELHYAAGAGADHQEPHSAAADVFLDLNFPPASPEEA